MNDTVAELRRRVASIAGTLDENDFALIPTTRDLFAIVDKKHEEAVCGHRWYAVISRENHVYAVADIGGHRVSLQRLIYLLDDPKLTLEEAKQISFENKCSFDCRKINLIDRVGRKAVMRNRRAKSTSTSKYKGVRKRKSSTGKTYWDAVIKIDRGHLYLGQFDSEVLAATTYDAAAFIFFEGAAFLNFPNERPSPDALETVGLRYARFRHRMGHSS